MRSWLLSHRGSGWARSGREGPAEGLDRCLMAGAGEARLHEVKAAVIHGTGSLPAHEAQA